DIVKPMKAETHSGPQHAIVQAPKQQPKVKTIVLPPAVTPGQEISMSFDVPGLARGDDSFSHDSGVPNAPSPGVSAQFAPSIIPTMEDEDEEAVMVKEQENPSKNVTPGFVKSQRKKRDLKSKSDRKHKAVVQRAKSFHGLPTRDKGAIEEHSVKAQDKQKAAKTIADILMFPMDKKLKGARMFAKQRKRSAKYTKETRGRNYDAD
ncbi:hypothetical protein, partial [Salmonella sp. S146_54837]|uniref:hypothetical protein n=1 Tax=Salmonella sp. S146_54837 TaxID=2665635 RepID=UPI001658F395